MLNVSRSLFAGSVLLALVSVVLLTAASFQSRDAKKDKNAPAEPVIGSRWEVYAGGGLYFLDRTSGELWVYHHPGDVLLKPKPKYLGRFTEVGKELD